MGHVDLKIRDSAASSDLGYYKGHVKDKARAVALSKEYAVGALGLLKSPRCPS